MKILMICPYTPYPLTDGGKVRVFNLIKRLSRLNNITLICYAKDKQEKAGVKALIPYCKKIIAIKRRPRLSIYNIFKYIFSFYPSTYIINGFSGEMSKSIKEELKRESYDIVQVEHFYSAGPVLKVVGRDIPMLLIEHNIEYKIYVSFAKFEKNVLKKLFYMLDSRRMSWAEEKTWSKFDGIVFMSKEDEHVFKTIYPEKRSYVVPNGVDVEQYVPLKAAMGYPSLVFLANFKYKANIDALRYFHDDILPLIRAKDSLVKLDVIGNDPNGATLRYSTENTHVHGYVDDTSPYMNSNNIFIAPLRIGGGIKLKVLEAMSAGMTVVGSSESFYGINITNGMNCVVEDVPEKFAEKIVAILKDDALRGDIGNEAADLMRKYYDWDILAKEMQNVYSMILREKEG